MIKIKHLEDVNNFLTNLDKEKAKKAIPIATQTLYENVKLYAKPHFKSGNMHRNIRHKIKNEAGIVWIDDVGMLVNWRGKKVNYAQFVLFGSKPHTITPKTRKALRFKHSKLDEFVFRKRVNHPGYKGDDFMKKAIEKTFSELEKLFKYV